MIQLPPEAVRDTVAAVFRQPAYDRSLRETIWRRLLTWFRELFATVGDALSQSAAAQATARVLLVVAGVLVAGRLALLAWQWWDAREQERRGGRRRGPHAAHADPWQAAQEEAAAGRYTEAAHLLYQALLQRLARRERLRLHASKTTGDYARELRRRSSSAFGPFREFAREYEIVVYGLQQCDRPRYERLRAAAQPLLGGADG